MMRTLGILLIAVMFVLSLMFLGWSGIIKLPSMQNSAAFPHVRTLVLNRKGNVLFLTQNYQAAFDNYVQTLEFDPFASEIHLDMGLTYEAQQQNDKAQLSYQNSLQYAKEDSLRFLALFNQAQLFGKAKKTDEALVLYQKALTINPASMEVKTNIELLIQQQQGQGGKDDKDKKDDKKDDKDKKDQKDQKDGKDPKDDKKDQNKDQNKDQDDKDKKDDKGKEKEKPKQYGQNQKPQPRKFKSEELSEGDVKKILQELKQQEQKIRAEFNRKEVKEQPRDKDW